MNSVFDAYDLPLVKAVDFYDRLNREIAFSDGMTTSLGIIYWGRNEHLDGIGKTLDAMEKLGYSTFSEVSAALKTPSRLRKFSETEGLPENILRILKHDIDMWLPTAVRLDTFDFFREHGHVLTAFVTAGFPDQLSVISSGYTPERRLMLARDLNLAGPDVDEAVKLCDFYRTGKGLGHIRSKLYYEMGLDTLDKWAESTSGDIIARFARYIAEKSFEDRLVPFPKEVRNGIEWAKFHLEHFAVRW